MNLTEPERFEDRLLAELRDIVAAQPNPNSPAPRRRLRGRLALGIGGGAAFAGAATLAAVAVFAGGSDSTAKAYAVELQPHGIVKVSIESPSSGSQIETFNPGDAASLEGELEEAGIPAVVDFEAAGRAECKVVPGGTQASKSNGIRRGGGQGEEGGAGLSTRSAALARVSSSALARKLEFIERAGGIGEAQIQEHGATVGKDGRGVTAWVDPSRIGPGEKLFIESPDGTMEGVRVLISDQDPSLACAGSIRTKPTGPPPQQPDRPAPTVP